MTDKSFNRRGFFGRVAAVVGGLVAIPALAQPAQARSWRRGWGWGWGSHRRFWGYPGYYGGYGGFGPRFYGGFGPRFYGGGGPFFYSRGYYSAPYAAPYYAPAPYAPYYGGGYYPPPGIYLRLNGPAKASSAALKMLET